MPRTDQITLPQASQGGTRRVEKRGPFILYTFLLFTCLLPPAQAGDILRGGATSANGRKAAGARANAGAQAAEIAKTKAADRLARTTKILNDMRQMQSSARAAGSALTVPDGLVTGGLERLPGGTWTGANPPSQSGSTVNIKQTASQALLDWKAFNVGKNTTLNFDQKAGGNDSGKWIAFNKVLDPSGVPSKILGKIKADGQVYIINQNGILFGSGSQVNTRTLVASSLPINDNLVKNGLLNLQSKNAQFLFSTTLADGTTPRPPMSPGQTAGNVIVAPGARIETSVDSGGSGGRIMLVGANVDNQGVISSPAGQIILAAGLQAGFYVHASGDPSLRGLDTYIGEVGNYGGTATNSGIIDIPTGSLTIAGKRVQQLGSVDSLTTVALNGRVDLEGSYNAVPNGNFDPIGSPDQPAFLYRTAGTVDVGTGSVIRILPDLKSASSAIGTSLPIRSSSHIRGGTVNFARDSILLAPNGQITIEAGQWRTATNSEGGYQRANPGFLATSGSVVLNANAILDVSGSTDVRVPRTQSILDVQLRGSELSLSPLQRNGELRGVHLTIDIRKAGIYGGRSWMGTPLGDASGFADIIERNAGQLTTAGGSIVISAGDRFTSMPGAVLDVSGGYYRYEGGSVLTSRLIYQGHYLVDVANATPDRLYDGIYSARTTRQSSKWGVTQTWAAPLPPTGAHAESEYIAGAAGGQLEITAPIIRMRSEVQGTTVVGPRQMRTSKSISTLPQYASLELSFTKQSLGPFAGLDFATISPTPPLIQFGNGGSGIPSDLMGSPSSEKFVFDSGFFSKSGFGSLKIENGDGNVLFSDAATIQLPPGGSLEISSRNIVIQGDIRVPSGKIALSAHNFSPFEAAILQANPLSEAPEPVAGQGKIILGSNVVLDAGGLVVDDRPTSISDQSQPFLINGGSVSLVGYDLLLHAGSRIDVTGGIGITSKGGYAFGTGGTITLSSGQDPTLKSLLGGSLELGAELRGYAGKTGGVLNIQAPLVRVGTASSQQGALLLAPSFFNRGGFSRFNLTGIGLPSSDEERDSLRNSTGDSHAPDYYVAAVVIEPGTLLVPKSENYIFTPNRHDSEGRPFGLITKPFGQRAPVSVGLYAPGVKEDFPVPATAGSIFKKSGDVKVRGDIVVSQGSKVTVEPGGQIIFEGQTVSMMGSADAPGGKITIKGAGSFPSLDPLPEFARATVVIAPGASLSTRGVAVYTSDPYGRKRGSLLPGGAIAIQGNIYAASGAVLDVSGASGLFDMMPAELGNTADPGIPTNSGVTAIPFALKAISAKLDSDAGTISLDGGKLLVTNATLLGFAGGPTALGGTLNVSSGRFYGPLDTATTADLNLQVSQANGLPLSSVNSNSAGYPVLLAGGAVLKGMGYFDADRFAVGGFDNLTLGKNLSFVGKVDVEARGYIDAATGGVISATDTASLTASYVRIGQPLRPPSFPAQQLFDFSYTSTGAEFNFAPTPGQGVLHVTADVIDIGTLSLSNMSSASFSARGGEIRGSGTLQISGRINMQAAMIYPTTASAFNVYAYDYPGGKGVVTIRKSGDARAVYSAGGTLNIQADTINQGGNLLAPFGRIILGWDGRGTAPENTIAASTATVPVTSHLNLLAGSLTSVSGINPSSGEEMLLPYGLSYDGLNWIDPRGQNITGVAATPSSDPNAISPGLPQKQVYLSGDNVSVESGSIIDMRGGGDLFAYRWVNGNGGSIDILSTNPRYEDAAYKYGSDYSFAVLPGFQGSIAPLVPFNPASAATSLDNSEGTRDPGYVHNSLSAGDRVYLGASSGLSAGYYTLLPARYALMPGAFLVTPLGTSAVGTAQRADGSSYVSGYRFNSLNKSRVGPKPYSKWDVAPGTVVAQRAEYEVYRADTFFPERAAALGLNKAPRLPGDGGYTRLQANNGLILEGIVRGSQQASALGSMMDISSSGDIKILGDAQTGAGSVVLKSSRLNSFDVGSLLIGGVRTFATTGPNVEVRSTNLELDNLGTSMRGPDIALVASGSLNLALGAAIQADGPTSSLFDSFVLSGNGAAIRVSTSADASLTRSGTGSSPLPLLTIGAGSRIEGSGVVLDSSYGFSLSPSASLAARTLTFGAGQIAILLGGPATLTGQIDQLHPQLVLSDATLHDIQQAENLRFIAYQSPIDLYGPGSFGAHTISVLDFQAAQIRGFNQGAGTTDITAAQIKISNPRGISAISGSNTPSGSLVLNSDLMEIATGSVLVSRFDNLQLNSSGGILFSGTGSLTTQINLTANAPLLTAAKGSSQGLFAGGDMVLADPGTNSAVKGGLGGSLSLRGKSVAVGLGIALPSGLLDIRATGPGGSVEVSGRISVAGTAQTFFDVTHYSNAGKITLSSDFGNISLLPGSDLDVSAATHAGDAGSLIIKAPSGTFTALGQFEGNAGTGGAGGSFQLDTGTLGSFSALATQLNDGGFDLSRKFRMRSAIPGGVLVVSGTTKVHEFLLTVDAGGISINGVIDASGVVGGSISLVARDSVVVGSGALLDVSGEDFSNAGKGGDVTIEAGTQINGVSNSAARITISNGSAIDLGVDTFVPGSATTPGSSAFLGHFNGTLHLRAPRTGGGAGTGIGINDIKGSILNPSSILAEGFKVYTVSGSAGTISSALQSQINTEGQTFLGAAGTTVANYTSMLASILASQPGLESVFVLAPGAEIINSTAGGDITLGTTASTSTSDWNLSTFRYGPKRAPGVLTIRSARDLVFYNALSDGFSPTLANTNGSWLWLAPISTPATPSGTATALPLNTQSWSYRFTSGADLLSADFREVISPNALPAGKGNFFLGKNYGSATYGSGASNLTATAVNNRFQVIRTGTGDIQINAGRNFGLMNQFATVYTAGIGRLTPATIFSANDFVVPITVKSPNPSQGSLGAAQQNYNPSYSFSGGNIQIAAQQDIGRYTQDNFGNTIFDSSRQLPTNWLYRRGYVDPATGEFGLGGVSGTGINGITDAAASTTWWVDFSNFFEGIGTLGGGDLTLQAGRDIVNVDAFAPTNARMPRGVPDATKLVEYGGGDLTLLAGRDVSGGVYYVENGNAVINAGRSITTNKSRSPSLGILTSANVVRDESTWLPTTLFLGRGGFDISARSDILLGPMVNPFLLPPGLNNRYWNKSYYSTYAADSSVRVSSLGGDVNYRYAVQLPTAADPEPALAAWMRTQDLYSVSYADVNNNASNFQPWLRLAEDTINPFTTAMTVAPPNLETVAFSGDINIAGDANFFPSSTGTIALYSSGSIIGLNPVGFSELLVAGQKITTWISSRLNLSDADPSAMYSIANPLGYQAVVGRSASSLNTTSGNLFQEFDSHFQESGSYTGKQAFINTKSALHAPGILHLGDDIPARFYATGGDISGMSLFLSKFSQIFSGQDISDIDFYLQNASALDTSIASAGRDIIPYNVSTSHRNSSSAFGNQLVGPVSSGDLQINGPGLFEVLAGRDLDLGTGVNNSDGTGVGITSIGNARNPFLPFEGASIIAIAGLGPSFGLANSSLQIEDFLASYENSNWDSFLPANLQGMSLFSLTGEQQSQVALALFFEELKKAAAEARASGSYEAGFVAIEALLGSRQYAGEIRTHSRDIRTKTGGDIYVMAPGGGLALADTILGSPLAPPGVVTEYGGSISIFTDKNVDIGKARIFTLRGGDITIWSSTGDIAAGTSAKTVVTAPPTRVVIDAQSASIQTDLAGLATGGGIGVLASVKDVEPGSVALIAPGGTVDAGDAGIRATGDITIAATAVLNADNVAAGGTSVGVPSAPTVAAPNVSGLTSGSSSTAAASSAANSVSNQATQQSQDIVETPSTITVEILGYGGKEEDEGEG